MNTLMVLFNSKYLRLELDTLCCLALSLPLLRWAALPSNSYIFINGTSITLFKEYSINFLMIRHALFKQFQQKWNIFWFFTKHLNKIKKNRKPFKTSSAYKVSTFEAIPTITEHICGVLLKI